MKLRFTLFYIQVSIKQCYAGPEELDNINQIITEIKHPISQPMKFSTYTMVTVHKGLYFKVQNELCRIYLNQSTCDSEKIEN